MNPSAATVNGSGSLPALPSHRKGGCLFLILFVEVKRGKVTYSTSTAMVFVVRKLIEGTQTLGEKLRTLRRSKAVSLPMLEAATRVQLRYLEALERGRYDELPEPLYTRNYLRAYARALGADDQYFLELYDDEVGQMDLLGPHRLPRVRVRKGRFLVFSKFLAAGALLAVVLSVVGYFVWQTSALLRPPSVVITNPNDGLTVDSALLSLDGYVKDQDVTVMIDGKAVSITGEQQFTADVDLTRGLNIITIEAKRRYSRKAVLYRRIFFSPEPETEVSLN